MTPSLAPVCLTAVVMHTPPILQLRAGITVGLGCIATQQLIRVATVERCLLLSKCLLLFKLATAVP